MKSIDLNGKKFGLLANSENGEVSSETIFEYKQTGDLVTAEYCGGNIRYGKILARQNEAGNLEMTYHCLTNDGELKAGKALATVSINEQGKTQLDLDWKWIDGDESKGTSRYVEID